MRYSILMMSAFGLALLVSGIPASAQDVEELEKMALALKKEAAELFEKGREDEAHTLERESEGLLLKVRKLQQAKQEKPGKSEGDREKKSDTSDPESQHLKQLLLDQLQEIPPQFRAQAEKLELAARRLQHLRVAAENLKAAEMHDMAEELMKKAEAMEREVHAAKSELAKAMQNCETKDQEPKAELQQLRSENEKLRREMKELREVIEQLRKETDK